MFGLSVVPRIMPAVEPVTITDAQGSVVFDMTQYAYLDADCPDTVNPSLWRQAQLNAVHGLFQVTEGVYQVTAIDEDDADGATRARYCRRADERPCRISTQKELFAFARATDARQKKEGALVLRLPTDNSEPLG